MPTRILGILAFLAIAAWAVLPAASASEDECLDNQVMELAGCVDLETVMAGDLQISHARIAAPAGGDRQSIAYFTILNRGAASDRLQAATALVARKVELRRISGQDGAERAETVEEGVRIEPGHRVELRPGGLHLALEGIGETLDPGSDVEITLDFEKAGRVVIDFRVTAPRDRSARSL